MLSPTSYSKNEGQLDTSSELREAISMKRSVWKALLTTMVVLANLA